MVGNVGGEARGGNAFGEGAWLVKQIPAGMTERTAKARAKATARAKAKARANGLWL